MAGASTPEGKGRRFDFQLNLIPMIDLLSVMISFLLITAIWIPISKLDAKQQPEQPDVVVQAEPDEDLTLRVLIKSTGYTISTRLVSMEVAGHDVGKSAEVHFPDRKRAQSIVAHDAYVQLAALDVLLDEGVGVRLFMNELDALLQPLCIRNDRRLRDAERGVLGHGLDEERELQLA